MDNLTTSQENPDSSPGLRPALGFLCARPSRGPAAPAAGASGASGAGAELTGWGSGGTPGGVGPLSSRPRGQGENGAGAGKHAGRWRPATICIGGRRAHPAALPAPLIQPNRANRSAKDDGAASWRAAEQEPRRPGGGQGTMGHGGPFQDAAGAQVRPAGGSGAPRTEAPSRAGSPLRSGTSFQRLVSPLPTQTAQIPSAAPSGSYHGSLRPATSGSGGPLCGGTAHTGGAPAPHLPICSLGASRQRPCSGRQRRGSSRPPHRLLPPPAAGCPGRSVRPVPGPRSTSRHVRGRRGSPVRWRRGHGRGCRRVRTAPRPGWSWGAPTAGPPTPSARSKRIGDTLPPPSYELGTRLRVRSPGLWTSVPSGALGEAAGQGALVSAPQPVTVSTGSPARSRPRASGACWAACHHLPGGGEHP